MANNEILATIEQYKQWKELAEEANKQMKEYEGMLKELLEESGAETLESGQYILRWTEILSNRFDTTAFKKENPEIYKLYLKQIPSKRFTLSE